jgi:DNA (cytosine-5)-methyltransferase 1
MTHLDLCSGIGGFTIAAQAAGFETVGFAEIEPYCCKILQKHWPLIKNYGDLRRADFSDLRGRITVLSAGFPCQPFSAAGKRRGQSDDRNLWPTVRDVIETVRPLWCVCENVPGLLSMGEFDGICDDLANLGYQFAVFDVPANSVGAKHRRYRLFIVANASSGRGDRSQEWQDKQSGGTEAIDASEVVADSDSHNGHGRCSFVQVGRGRLQREAKANCQFRNFERLTEPALCLPTDGIRNRSHQLRALGNAVVPQQAFPFFQAIAQVIQEMKGTKCQNSPKTPSIKY